jgi:NAD(P)-dependent dehydrogenase (short-subunit alcohol dehydrogenase family)
LPTTLITGANRGLGLELTRQYAADGWRVIACARQPDASALQDIVRSHAGMAEVHALDVTDHAAIDRLAAALAGTAIDVLLNVAGTMGSEGFASHGPPIQRFGSLDYDDWAQILAVNVLAQVKMSEAFVDHVAASGQKKIVTLSSQLGSIGENTRGGLYGYRTSKAAVNAAMKSMAVDLAPREIIVVPMHPGWVRTDMGGPAAPLDAAGSAAGMRRVIAQLTLRDSGRFLRHDGSELPW